MTKKKEENDDVGKKTEKTKKRKMTNIGRRG